MPTYDSLIAKTIAAYDDLIWSCWLYCGRSWHTPECMKGIPRG